MACCPQCLRNGGQFARQISVWRHANSYRSIFWVILSVNDFQPMARRLVAVACKPSMPVGRMVTPDIDTIAHALILSTSEIPPNSLRCETKAAEICWMQNHSLPPNISDRLSQR